MGIRELRTRPGYTQLQPWELPSLSSPLSRPSIKTLCLLKFKVMVTPSPPARAGSGSDGYKVLLLHQPGRSQPLQHNLANCSPNLWPIWRNWPIEIWSTCQAFIIFCKHFCSVLLWELSSLSFTSKNFSSQGNLTPSWIDFIWFNKCPFLVAL